MSERRHSPDGGFAMPVAIFALVILGVLVTAGFFMAQQESRIGTASEHGALAFNLAEKGVSNVLESWRAEDFRTIAIGSTDTVTGTEGEGTWEVEIFRASPKIVFLESTGTVTRGGVLRAGASRKVGVTARLFYANLATPAALTTRGETNVLGNSEVNGYDTIPATWALAGVCAGIPADDKPGILVDSLGSVHGKGSSHVDGDPDPIVEDTTINDSTFTVFGNLTYDDLVTLAQLRFADGVTLTGLQPSLDGGGNCDLTDDHNWGDPLNPTLPCGGHFPIVHIEGSGNINGDVAQGILLVDQDLNIQGNFIFHGIIIVQGFLDIQGTGGSTTKIVGGVMASNADVGDNMVAGSVDIAASTCTVERAIRSNQAVARARPLAIRSWVDVSSIAPSS